MTWTQSYDTSGTILRSVSFLNVDDGFAFGGGSPGKAYKTTNGGTSWFDNSGSLPAITTSRSLYGATHELSTDIYVGGNLSTLIRYNGSTWSDVSKGTSHNAYDLYANSSSTVLSITSLSAAADYGLRTTNSGGSWSEPATFPQDKVVTGIDFYGATGIMCSARNSTSDKIYKSPDGGVTWAVQLAPTVDAMKGVSYPTPATAYMVGVNQTGLNGRVWKSINGGVLWSDISGNLPGGVSNTHRLQVVRFFDANKGWAGTSFGDVLYTTNGGTSWTVVDADVNNTVVNDMMMIVEWI